MRMNPFRRPLPWREPPIVFQILVLLLAGLVVAQLVTLLLTLVLPPAPPAQHSFGDVVAALKGEHNGGRLLRREQSGPPDFRRPGWFTSAQSQHQLAEMLGARDDDVRLAFYAPLPFAGITAPPTMPLPIEPVAWQTWPQPLRGVPLAPIATQARLIPASLVMEGPGPAGGGFPGGVMGGGNGGRGIGGGAGGFGHDRGQRGALGGGGGASRPDDYRGDRGQSPGDLDRQPIGPYGQGEGPGLRDGAFGADALHGQDRLPNEGFAAPAQTPVTQLPAPTQNIPSPADAATGAHSAAPPHAEPRVADRPEAAAAPLSAAPTPQPLREARRATPQIAHAVPMTSPDRALFGLAPAPFVEGDFVAALRLPDGRWAVVQPVAEAFPNAWQRRVMLWFAIAFALVAPVGWIFARHIVRPLARFTEAAEQLGRDPSAALVALEGPAEIGRAARAFNVMQSRLRSFVDDRTAMVGAISHDLRTPLTRLRFRIEEVEDDGIREGMNMEVAEMEAMITSVLSFIRDASTPNVRERLDLGMLMEDVAQDAAMIGGDVTVELNAPTPVEVDVLGMRRLLANLVENAVKYGERARIRLGIDDNAAVAEIIDDGPGVPEDELERAFEPFYRASNATSSGKSGTGLGLAVCRSIARAHGGDVRLLRSPEGFSAELRLPLAHETGRIAA